MYGLNGPLREDVGEDEWEEEEDWEGIAAWADEEGEWASTSNNSLKRSYPTSTNGPPAKRQATQSNGDTWTSQASTWHATGGAISPADKADIQQWLGCTRLGQNVPGTNIVPCKTPFEGPLANRAHASGILPDDEWFGKAELVQAGEAQGTPIGLVIDLVNTTKYYTGFTKSDGVEYRKMAIPGRTVPERRLVDAVCDLIDEFWNREPNKYVAIHCTHGVNRTGFLVAAYLMTRTKKRKSSKAVAAFEKARGMKMDKEYLLDALSQLEEGNY